MNKQSDGRRWGRLRKYGISAEENKQKVEAGFLWCCFCKQFLTSDKFTAYQLTKKISLRCIECDRARSKKWQAEHSDHHKKRMRAYYDKNADVLRQYARDRRSTWTPEERTEDAIRRRLKQRFGLSVQQYNDMLEEQGGCAICKTPQNGEKLLPIDHDHACCSGRKSCGKCIRGILCHRCNMLIGFLEKNKDLIPKCEAYLARST